MASNDVKVSIVIFLLSLIVYLSNAGILIVPDTLPNSLFALNLLKEGTVNFKTLEGSNNPLLRANFPAVSVMPGQVTTVYPIGAAIVTFPLYVLYYAALRASGAEVDLRSADFEPLREHLEKWTSCLLTALTVMGLFLVLRKRFPLSTAIVVCVLTAFGTSFWSVNSQNLWSHTSTCFLLVLFLLVITSNEEGKIPRNASLALGFSGGLLLVTRPTNVFFVLALLSIVAIIRPRQIRTFLFACFAALLPGLWYNYTYLGTPFGGYVGLHGAAFFDLRWDAVCSRFFMLLFHPKRGLFFFSPFLLFSIPGCRAALREQSGRPVFLPLLLSSLALLIFYSCIVTWHGGFCFGPRFLVDIVPFLAFFSAFQIHHMLARRSKGALAAIFLLGIWSVGLQFLGTFNIADSSRIRLPIYNYGDMNAPPMRAGIDSDPLHFRSYKN